MRAAALLLAALLPGSALAHAVGERYDLPAPLGFFIAGAAATVLATFIVAIVAVRRARALPPEIASWPAPGWISVARIVARSLGVALLVLVIVAGLAGEDHPAKSIAPTLVWIYGWVGLSLLAALVCDVWPAIDPWRALDRSGATARATAPSLLAVALFLAFAWLEVLDPLVSRPSHLAWLLIAWTLVTLAGLWRYGATAWRSRVDPLSLYFATLGRFAPLGFDAARARFVFRPWGRALAAPAPVPVAFVVAMLSTVLFDGLLGTQLWRRIDTEFLALAPALADRQGIVLGTIGLVVVWIVFLAAYRLATRSAAQLFVMTLVPIAVAYLVAHNLTYLVVQGQGLWSLASDPLGLGWNLFGSAGHVPDAGLVSARATWFVAIAAIVGGHVMAVWLAHRVALAHWPTTRSAVIASLPLTILMIAYTAVSLAIVAEPLTRFRTPDPSYSCRGCDADQFTRYTPTTPTPVAPPDPETTAVYAPGGRVTRIADS